VSQGSPTSAHPSLLHPRRPGCRWLRDWELGQARAAFGVTAYAPFCEKRTGLRPNLDNVIDHIAYIAERWGIDHVGIGSDFFEGESWICFERFFRRRYPAIVGKYTMVTIYVEGLGRVDDLVALRPALLRRGFSEDEAAKVLGGNVLRVFAGVWDEIEGG
jgi:membrane dipeptidase